MVSANADEKSNYAHVSDAIKTYSYYFDNYGYQTIVNAGEEVVTLDTRSAKEKTVSLTAPKTVKKYLKKDFDKDLIKTKYEGVNFVTPFTKTNVKLGVFSVYFGEQLLEQMPLVLNQKLTFSLFSFIKDNILFIILAIAIIISIIKINKIKHNKRQTNKNVCHRKNI